ncbi:MAG: PRD domain-containing protein [Alkalibacterium sp.]|nr:PRD domain-containing protein [Alkalibacterium sp.]
MVTYEKEFQTAKSIVDRLRKSSEINLPDEEIYNIALHLRNKRSNVSSDRISYSQDSVREQIIHVLEKMDKDLDVSLAQDPVLLNGLNDHFLPFLNRLRHNNKLKNPFMTEMKANYQPELDLTETYFSEMPELKAFTVTEDEWAYISLHIIAALERNSRSEKLRTLVICATGIGSSQMLKVRLENELGSKLDIVNVISYYEITDEMLHDIDLIVSSIDLSNVVFNIPVINVSVLLNQEDIRSINKLIGRHKSFKQTNIIEEKINRQHLSRLIDNYFNPDFFVISDQVKTREEAIDVLANKSVELDNQINQTFLKGQLKLRESFSSVVFSKHIAVPHPIEGMGEFSKVGILLTPHGIDWDESSNEVKLTILMIPDRF